MKKHLTICLLLLAALLMAIPALAASTKEEWEASCNWEISHSTTLYSMAYNDDVASGTDLYTFTPIGTIAKGEKVSIRSSAEGMREIYYWDGGRRSAWVEESAVRWVGSSSDDNEGNTDQGGDNNEGGDTGDTGDSGNTDSGNTGNGGNTGSGSGNSGNTSKPSSGSTNRPSSSSNRNTVSDTWEDFDLTLILEEGETKSVTLQTLGTAQCIVFDGTTKLTVNTEDLVWETEADDDQRLAIIYAPKTGKATLRASASSSAKAIDQCLDGRIVVVLKVGSTFTRVLYEGKEGCVLTAALTFTGSVPAGEFDVATLCYKGRTDSSATITVYTAKTAKRKINQWRVGTEVVVLNVEGNWSEVEIDGWHGWVKNDYLQ